jgi:hypothetical protein
MCLLQLVGLESSFTDSIAPTGPVLSVPGMAVNAGLSFEASSAKRHPAVCCCGALDFADDMVAIHVGLTFKKESQQEATETTETTRAHEIGCSSLAN